MDDDAREIRDSGLFDREWYLRRYSDVSRLGMDPVTHYLRIGALLKRAPGPGFSTAFYLRTHPDVARSGVNPLLHYIRHGRDEGRPCLPPQAPLGRKVLSKVATPSRPGRFERISGRLEPDTAAHTVLVCAHVAGKHLFGGERSLLDILDGFRAIGINVVVTIPGNGNAAYLEALRERSVAVVCFPYTWWRNDRPLDEERVARFAGIMADEGVDAVHVNTIMLPEPLAAARRMGLPSVVHVRELIRHDAALIELIGLCPEAIIDRVLGTADAVVANSDATARAFGQGKPTFVVPNTVDVQAFEMPRPAGGEDINIALISSNLPKKGVLDFVEVAQRLVADLPNARFLLIGPRTEAVEGIEERMARGDLPANIVLAGYRERPQDAVREADIVVNLSHFQESFGRTVLEAMAGGRPVIVYDWGALPELVIDGETGFVVPFRDVDAVAGRIRVLYEDRDRLRSMGAAARERALACYTPPHYAMRLQACYRTVLDEPRPEPEQLVLPARGLPESLPADKPLRIAYFLWHFPVPSETFVLNELRLLVAQGHDVHVYCRQSPHAGFEPDFPIHWTRVGSCEELANALVETRRQVVHSHFVYPTVTEMVWPACERAGVDFTFIAHAQDIFRYANEKANRIDEVAASERCLRVLVPSRFHWRYLAERGVPEHKLLLNPNGMDPGLYAEARDAARAGRRHRSICAVHRFAEKKGLEHLVRAAPELATEGISVHLYGYGELEERYRELIDELGVSNVHIHGPVKGREALLSVFMQHDLFACPSVRAADGDMDGIPTVLMEAMASGLPVLSTGLSGIPELVVDGVTGVICEPTAEGIVAATRRFYGMPDVQVAAMIDNAVKRVEDRFSSPRLVDGLLRLWRRQTLDVMIVSWNNLAELREVVERLQRFTALPFHLIICDNASEPDVAAWLCSAYARWTNTTVVYNRRNAYVGPGTNICMAQGCSDLAVYVCGKEGFVLGHGWERGLIEYMQSNPDVGLAGTLCYSPSYLYGADYPKGVREFPRFRNQAFALENPTRRFAHVQGGFFAIRRSMFEAIGGFSEAVPHSYTDVEYSYYVESMGWRLGTPPGVLALFNKTRPGLTSRIDENVLATHPPRLEDLPLHDAIADAEVAFCNLCGWLGKQFEDELGKATCPGCGSRPADRSLYRFLAESTLTHRRLPALAVNLGGAVQTIWRQQFQGPVMQSSELLDRLDGGGRLDVSDGSLRLVLLDSVFDDTSQTRSILTECRRVLADDGVLVLRMGEGLDQNAEHECVDLVREVLDIDGIQSVRFSSKVLRYDPCRLLVCRLREIDLCVS